MSEEYIEIAHDEWVWALTNPLEKGIQKNWEYKCAYCGTIIKGELLIENPNCPKCGAPLYE